MSYVVTEYCFVEVATMFPAEYLKDARFLRRLVKNTLAQLPPALDRLLSALHPFLEGEDTPAEMGYNAVTFLK
jgi:hypothetical protein